jgi:uncharacterized membrane protein YcjF (UPF0283 family)
MLTEPQHILMDALRRHSVGRLWRVILSSVLIVSVAIIVNLLSSYVLALYAKANMLDLAQMIVTMVSIVVAIGTLVANIYSNLLVRDRQRYNDYLKTEVMPVYKDIVSGVERDAKEIARRQSVTK